MMVSIIAAISENGVIGHRGALPWRLASDLRRFRLLTMGHHLVMGRRTWESIGRPLPGRTTVVISRDRDLKLDGATVVTSLDAALDVTSNDPEVFVIGGGEIYRLALPVAQRLYITRVHVELAGETLFPPVKWDEWELTGSERGAADKQNDFDFTFEVYDRLGQPPIEQQMVA